ncbi:heavy-metal-associated domain-containing protein [Pseudooceanicola nanhaiensis]|uniref:heavy-metal-associated domain-containing protein n=1 Tax=Pseudooceanicola nanhaiensis TaxID=375761 RepID=UPI001CD65E9D|nr:heavy-metal-associated domain-containing protein [Pseudooceanicola nanhaiensis]MCA0920788.1 heavy-metal-associated domain-containing protein [Pseudooceanicola nanhaiensis]
MTKFQVPDMSCGHCSKAITKAITELDPAAQVTCDLESKIVSVESAQDAAALKGAIESEGYAVSAA